MTRHDIGGSSERLLGTRRALGAVLEHGLIQRHKLINQHPEACCLSNERGGGRVRQHEPLVAGFGRLDPRPFAQVERGPSCIDRARRLRTGG
jgi:hypothetical protein